MRTLRDFIAASRIFLHETETCIEKRKDFTFETAFAQGSGIMNTVKKQPSEHSKVVLDSLKAAVTNALEKKRRLGQYAVFGKTDKSFTKGMMLPI